MWIATSNTARKRTSRRTGQHHSVYLHAAHANHDLGNPNPILLCTLGTFYVLRMNDAIWPVSQLVTGRDRLARQEVECFCQHASHLLLAGRVNVLASAASPGLHQLFGGSLLGLAQAATENGQQVKPDIGVAAEDTAQYTAEFP